MGSKSSGDDPMDLGPFLQNYVMKNPFKVQQHGAAVTDGRGGGRPGDGMTLRSRSAAEKGQFDHVTASLSRRWRSDVDDASTLNGVDERASVSSQSAELLLQNSEASSHDDVTSWLHDNYRCVPGRYRLLVATQHLQLHVQQVFPHVTGDTVDQLVLAAFPHCMKINNKKTGLYFYQGLIARPDPEVYENPAFLAALDSVTSRRLTTHQAAEKFGIRETALVAAVSWSDHELRRAVLTTADGVSGSNTSLQSDSSPSNASHKRPHLSDSEHSSLDEPHRRRLKTSVDDGVDFEMMLQDVAASGGEKPNTDCSVSQSSLESDVNHSIPWECISVKAEPPSTPSDSQTQPINFCLSGDSRLKPGTNTKSSAGDNKVRPSSPATAALETSTVDCSDADASHQRSELEEALATNLALQEELSARDFHLAQLAEDFFCLHEHFKQLARHFQAVLGDIQPLAADQSRTNRVTHNHSS